MHVDDIDELRDGIGDVSRHIGNISPTKWYDTSMSVYKTRMTKSKKEKERLSMEHSSKNQTCKDKDILQKVKEVLQRD